MNRASPTIHRVVLVDDNEPDNIYHEAVLRRVGFAGDVQVFEHTPDALRFLRACDPKEQTLVLLDVNMPGMNGWEFAQQLAAPDSSDPSIQLVMLSSSSASVDQERALRIQGVKAYCTKPLTKQLAMDLLSANANSTSTPAA